MKKTTVDLVEQSEKVSFYSISFQMDRTTEFERLNILKTWYICYETERITS